MITHIDRDEIEITCNVIAGLSQNHRNILDKDQYFILAQAHSIIESLATLAQYRTTRECKMIEVPTDVTETSVVSKLSDQSAYWGQALELDLSDV